MYPENPEGTQVIVGSMNMGYISDTARNRTHNLLRPKREPIPLGHSDGLFPPPYYLIQGEFKKLGGILSPPNSAWKQLLPFPPA